MRVISEAEACSHSDELLSGESAQTVSELLSSLRPCLHRGTARCPQSSDHLHTALTTLGHARRLAGLLPARAALSASEGLDLALRGELRCRRLGRSTSSTSIPCALK